MVHETVNPEMIKLARQSRGYTQKELAKLVNVVQPQFSRIEAGTRPVHDSALNGLCEVLDYPSQFFIQRPRLEGPGTDVTFHRKRQSVRKSKLDQVYAIAEVRKLEVVKLLEWEGAEYTIPSYPIELFDDDPAKIARTVRVVFGLPSGPVFNMTRTLEQVGCVVIAHNFGSRYIDGFSRPGRIHPPFFHISRDLPPDRWRWTLAHELGHVVMEHDPVGSPKLIEAQANQFAAEFLAPSHEIASMLQNLTISKLAGLKLEWKISMQALIERAFHLGTITRAQRTGMHIRLSRAGYKTREPDTLDPPGEPPQRLFMLAKTHMTELEYSREELLNWLAINEKDFQEYYHDPLDVGPQAGDSLDNEWRLP